MFEIKNTRYLSDKLITTLFTNDVDELIRLKETGESFGLCNKDGNTLLHLCVLFQSKDMAARDEIFDYLLKSDDIPKNAKNNKGRTALMEVFLSLKSYPEWAIKLIKSGCDIRDKFPSGNCTLHLAIENKWLEVAELLIELGHDVDYPNCLGETPLHLACERGHIDEIWMLLFFGANPNSQVWWSGLTCFDIAGKTTQCELRDIFLKELIYYDKNFHLSTFIEVMENNADLFYELLGTADNINYNRSSLLKFWHKNSKFKTELFRLFLEKFDYVVIKALLTYTDIKRSFCAFENSSSSETENTRNLCCFVQNVFTLLQSNASDVVVNILSRRYSTLFLRCELSAISAIVALIKRYKKEEQLLIGLIYCMLSYGVKLYDFDVYHIYCSFKYSDFFKTILHMTIEKDEQNPSKICRLVPEFFYNVSLTEQDYISYCKDNFTVLPDSIYPIFEYFSSPKLIRRCRLEHIKSMYHVDLERNIHLNENYMSTNRSFVELRRNLPVVPTLVELSRNRFREYLIHKCQINTYGYFYAKVNSLEVPEVIKEILTYQRKLYRFSFCDN